MKIESISLKTVTVAIFAILAFVAILLSLFASSYFKQAALDAQVNSLSRVIEVATEETLNEIRKNTFDLGMKLGHSQELIKATSAGNLSQMTRLLDDPFINGFVGFANVDLVKLRVFSLNLELIAQNSSSKFKMENNLDKSLATQVFQRQKSERLKAVDALWFSSDYAMFSTLVPIGGLRPVGYLEIVVNPAFNLPDIRKITKTPVQVFDMKGEPVSRVTQNISGGYLPVKYILNASNGKPAFTIIGYENIVTLNQEMEETRYITISGFLALSLVTLVLALWIFGRFLFMPVTRMIKNMQKITDGNMDLIINNHGLKEFNLLANAFNRMTEQVRLRTRDLQKLLDLDNNALMCFDSDNDAVYFNETATALFGYHGDEISDLDLADLFVDDIHTIIKNTDKPSNIHAELICKHKDGHQFECQATVNIIDVMGQKGLAIALAQLEASDIQASEQEDQRLNLMEQTLSSLLSLAQDNPGIRQELNALSGNSLTASESGVTKLQLREHAVKVMNLALNCWTQDTGKSKLDMAEESRIWPVYIDKSTPTTRTLDKYLNVDSCPKNPRNQRIIDTAEFVLKKTRKLESDKHQELKAELDTFRLFLSGIK